MGGGASKTPTDQNMTMEEESEYGPNLAKVEIDMHESQESNFLAIHQSTLVGMVTVMVILVIIGIMMYACLVCWCRRIHEMCGATNQTTGEAMEMVEQGEAPSKRGPAVTLIKSPVQ